MPAARIPNDETDRLQALRRLDVLDSLPEAFSDAIATAAAAIAGVPISAISLVDAERQWFKASCGLAVSETSRDSSFCAHAILAREPLLIADTLADERFRDNALVTGAPYIRTYAGFPLVVGGQAVGALCVIDDRPRVFSVDVVEQLTRLARGTSAWLTDRQHLAGSLEHTREQLRQVTFHDPTTGLPTRILLQDRLMQVVRRADRTKQRVAVLYLRLRPLDPGGQPTALELDGETLHAAGQRLTRAIRAADTVARVGDSDFVILAEGQGNIEAARRLAASIRAAFEPAIQRGACDLRLGTAIGVSLYPQDGAGEHLVGQAALACTQPAARTDCSFFHRELEQSEQLRSDLLDQLRRARERKELELHYQPQFDAHSGDVTGVEALVRWRHPVLGSLLPMDFIPLAEESGLMDDIGRWVMAEAFGQIRRWREIGIVLRVAINLSARQLRRPALAEEIEALMKDEGVDPASVTFEVTESVTMDDATSAAFVFERLRVLGVQISIDDFGTGYSNLPYLRRLSVRELKIDKSVVAELGGSDDAHVVVQAIIQLGHAMGMELIAEGVETEAQRRVLCELGCDQLQGFLLARPMPAETLAAWMGHRELRTIPA